MRCRVTASAGLSMVRVALKETHHFLAHLLVTKPEPQWVSQTWYICALRLVEAAGSQHR